jgi:PST family polysaccharide transporter
VVRWQILGVFLQVVSWPLGYVLIAKGKSLLFALTELAFGVINIVLILLCLNFWQLEGVGIAFALSYLGHTVMTANIAWQLIGFRWSATTLKILAPTILILGTIFLCTRFLPEWWSIGIGLLATAAAGLASLHVLQKLLGVSLWQRLCRKLQPAA